METNISELNSFSGLINSMIAEEYQFTPIEPRRIFNYSTRQYENVDDFSINSDTLFELLGTWVTPEIENTQSQFNGFETESHINKIKMNQEVRQVKASEIVTLIKTGYVRKVGDKHYDSEKKNSIMDYYNITKEEVDTLFKYDALKNIRVSIPKTSPGLSFEFIDDSDTIPQYGKRSASSKRRAAVANTVSETPSSKSTEQVDIPQPEMSTNEVEF